VDCSISLLEVMVMNLVHGGVNQADSGPENCAQHHSTQARDHRLHGGVRFRTSAVDACCREAHSTQLIICLRSRLIARRLKITLKKIHSHGPRAIFFIKAWLSELPDSSSLSLPSLSSPNSTHRQNRTEDRIWTTPLPLHFQNVLPQGTRIRPASLALPWIQ